MISLSLKPQPDGFGFIYGTASGDNDTSWLVNIMPPKHLWRGDIELPDCKPHASDYVIFIDGTEIARVSSAAAIEPTIIAHLTTAP